MKKSFAFLFLIMSGFLSAMTFDGNFESGHLSFVLPDGNLYEVDNSPYLFFRISGALNQRPEFFIDQQNATRYFANGHKMLYRYEGEDSVRVMDEGILTGNEYYFYNNSPFTQNTVYVSYTYPFTYTQNSNWLASLNQNQFVQNIAIRGLSPQNRDIYSFRVTDTAINNSWKKKIVLTCRQHAPEALGNLVLQNFINYLVTSNDSTAINLRRKAIFYVYPLINPDGVYTASANPNSEPEFNTSWLPGPTFSGEPSGNAEVDLLRQAIYMDTNGLADYAVDFHANPGYNGNFYWWGPVTGPSTEIAAAAQQFVSWVFSKDSENHFGNTIVQAGIAHDNYAPHDASADYWFCTTLQAAGLTLETASVPFRNKQRIAEFSQAIAQAFNLVLPLPAPPTYPEITVNTNPINVSLQVNQETSRMLSIYNDGNNILSYQIRYQPQGRNIAGSTLTASADYYEPGQNFNFLLTVFNNSTDDEWLTRVTLSLPGGVSAVTGTDFLGGTDGPLVYNNATGEGATLIWQDNNSSYGNIYNGEYAIASLTLHVANWVSGALEVPFTIEGDGYNGQPHSVAGTLVFLEGALWLEISPREGNVQPLGEAPITLNFDARGRTEGIYQGQLHIISNDLDETDIYVPISMTVTSTGIQEQAAARFEFLGNFPNPFNPRTTISCNLQEMQKVTLEIFNSKGQKVKTLINTVLPAGRHDFEWQGKNNLGEDVSSGLYFCKATFGTKTITHKMMLMK